MSTSSLTEQSAGTSRRIRLSRIEHGICQIERGEIAGHDVLARYATALGSRLHQAIDFDDGDITAIA